MTEVRLRDNETLEKMLRRFRREDEHAGILKEVRRRQAHLEPSARRPDKRAADRKRRRRSAARRRWC